jgi:hypothetical protein
MQEAVRKAYAELHRAPIGTAPRLVVPAHVADRTMPQGEDTLRSDTSRPVERSERPPVTIRGPMPLAAVVALGGAVALGAAIGVASWARGAAVRGAASSSAGPTTLQPVVVTASGPGARVLGAPTAPVALAQETATELSGSESADAAVRLDPPAASDGVTRHSLRQRPVQAGASPASSATPFGYKTDVPY